MSQHLHPWRFKRCSAIYSWAKLDRRSRPRRVTLLQCKALKTLVRDIAVLTSRKRRRVVVYRSLRPLDKKTLFGVNGIATCTSFVSKTSILVSSQTAHYLSMLYKRTHDILWICITKYSACVDPSHDTCPTQSTLAQAQSRWRPKRLIKTWNCVQDVGSGPSSSRWGKTNRLLHIYITPAIIIIDPTPPLQKNRTRPFKDLSYRIQKHPHIPRDIYIQKKLMGSFSLSLVDPWRRVPLRHFQPVNWLERRTNQNPRWPYVVLDSCGQAEQNIQKKNMGQFQVFVCKIK